MNLTFWKIFIVVMPCVFATHVLGIERDRIVYFDVHTDHLLVRRETGSFVAAHISKAGDTFQSLSQEFYGNPDEAGVLAQVAGLSMDSAIPPGTTVYMIESSIIIPFGDDSREIQFNEALGCAERMKNQSLVALWDATLPVVQSHGETRQPTVSQLSLQTVEGKQLKLEIIFAPGTIWTHLLKGKVAAKKIHCLSYN